MDVFLELDNRALLSDSAVVEEGSGWLSGPHIRALMALKNSIYRRSPQAAASFEMQQPIEEPDRPADQLSTWDVHMDPGTANIGNYQLVDMSASGYVISFPLVYLLSLKLRG